MSFLKKLFNKKKQTVPSTSESIQKLHDMEKILLKKQVFLEQKLEEEHEIAKKNASTNKRIALQALKRKKRYEQQLEQLQGTLTTIETQRETLENANTNATVLDTMKGASDALKKTHKDMNIDKVQDVMDEVVEQNDVSKEISNAISSAIVSNINDDELSKELDAIIQESIDSELLNVDPIMNKPLLDILGTDLPTTSKNKEKQKENLITKV